MILTQRRPQWLRVCTLVLAFVALLLTITVQAQPISEPTPYAQRPEVQEFARSMAHKHGWSEAWVLDALKEARYQPKVAQLIMPATASPTKNWLAYRARMVEPTRLRAGLLFWRANKRWLDRAQRRFGVPADVIMGILGVESIYGKQTGQFRVLDTLATLGFDFPSGRSDRSPFFRSELEALLGLAQAGQIDVLTLKGSFAGAVGSPQFMPSSVQKYAVDFDDNGRLDLQSSPADMIGSIANYLSSFGWQAGWSTHFEVNPPNDDVGLSTLLGPDIVPLFSPDEFISLGARLPASALQHPGKLALVMLHNGDAEPTYVAGTSNFYVITRYNQSSYYAMAVIALGDALRQALGEARRAAGSRTHP